MYTCPASTGCPLWAWLTVSAEQFSEVTSVLSRQVGDDDVRKAWVRRHGCEECLERVKAAGRGAERGDGQRGG